MIAYVVSPSLNPRWLHRQHRQCCSGDRTAAQWPATTAGLARLPATTDSPCAGAARTEARRPSAFTRRLCLARGHSPITSGQPPVRPGPRLGWRRRRRACVRMVPGLRQLRGRPGRGRWLPRSTGRHCAVQRLGGRPALRFTTAEPGKDTLLSHHRRRHR